jgi:hypothetical protein
VLAFQHSDAPQPRFPDPRFPEQVHLDLYVDDAATAHERARRLGAAVLYETEHHCVYADPAVLLEMDTNALEHLRDRVRREEVTSERVGREDVAVANRCGGVDLGSRFLEPFPVVRQDLVQRQLNGKPDEATLPNRA